MLTIKVEQDPDCPAERRREFVARVTASARELLGCARLEFTEDEPALDARARREAAILAASWSGC
ncbi:hypothetical protein OIE66_09310 [Nonomuraea sp. NBC_01738]|uniref:hypothetical protein n=1 Tax=Nonomuraea sp. NBC_01738 TaxID=2976003 RepID=UPI002E1471C8|nr:hypothetical protein OIE66_09310 [Nonomuraea sp. NBC_01738]